MEKPDNKPGQAPPRRLSPRLKRWEQSRWRWLTPRRAWNLLLAVTLTGTVIVFVYLIRMKAREAYLDRLDPIGRYVAEWERKGDDLYLDYLTRFIFDSRGDESQLQATVARMLELLEHERPPVRRAAIRALTFLPDEGREGVAPRLGALLTAPDPDPRVREEAAAFIARLPGLDRAADWLFAAARDPEVKVRLHGVNGLGRLAVRLSGRLDTALGRDPDQERRLARFLAGEGEPPPEWGPVLAVARRQAAIRDLVARTLVETDDERERLEAVQAAQDLWLPGDERLFPALLGVLDVGSELVRAETVRLIFTYRLERGVRGRPQREAELRRRCRALAGYPEGVPDGNGRVRAFAISCLGALEVEGEDLVPLYLRGLADPDQQVRNVCLGLLRERMRGRDLTPIIVRLGPAYPFVVRKAAALILGGDDDPETADPTRVIEAGFPLAAALGNEVELDEVFLAQLRGLTGNERLQMFRHPFDEEVLARARGEWRAALRFTAVNWLRQAPRLNLPRLPRLLRHGVPAVGRGAAEVLAWSRLEGDAAEILIGVLGEVPESTDAAVWSALETVLRDSTIARYSYPPSPEEIAAARQAWRRALQRWRERRAAGAGGNPAGEP